MKTFLAWLENRTGVHGLMHEALFERIPGGARWRYVWGSTLVFAFFVQLVTGIFLWMSYSPSAQTAWESVYYIQYEMNGGWLLRGLHHFMAQAMVVLLAIHLLQVVVDGAYRAPREVNFWLGLILMLITLGLSLTGYLLPWDQKGYWATRVATNLTGIVPVVGKDMQQLVVGGPDYGHHTLTRFFALHAGVLPAMLIGFLVLHIALFRRHGITAKQPLKRADSTFWPDQVLKDAVACLAVLVVVLLLIIHFDAQGLISGKLNAAELGAELGAPADGSTPYSAARPEWYFLFLFQFLKLFEGMGETGEFLGAIVVPGFVLLMLFAMPLIGRWKLGHRFNIGFTVAILIGIGLLTYAAMREDYRAKWAKPDEYREIAKLYAELGSDDAKIGAHFKDDAAQVADYRRRVADYEKYRKSADFLVAVEQSHAEAERAKELAAGPNKIPAGGALSLLRDDPATQGPRLFAQYCASCHSYLSPDRIDSLPGELALMNASAPNLYGFGSREWIAGLLDPKLVASERYFGSMTRYKKLKAKGESMEMVDYVLSDDFKALSKEDVEKIVIALSAQAQLPSQRKTDGRDHEKIAAGNQLITDNCAGCHRFEPTGKLGTDDNGYPDLTQYASREWLLGMICNPAAPQFYGENNDRMPAFAPEPPPSDANRLTPEQLNMLVDWLRGDYYRKPAEALP